VPPHALRCGVSCAQGRDSITRNLVETAEINDVITALDI
jgi:hypothetical protein